MAESLYHTKKNTKDAAINLLKETCIGSVYYAVQERMDHGAIFMLNCLAEVMVGKS